MRRGEDGDKELDKTSELGNLSRIEVRMLGVVAVVPSSFWFPEPELPIPSIASSE